MRSRYIKEWTCARFLLVMVWANDQLGNSLKEFFLFFLSSRDGVKG